MSNLKLMLHSSESQLVMRSHNEHPKEFFELKIMRGEVGFMKFTGTAKDAATIIEAMQNYLPPKQLTIPDTEMLDKLEKLVKEKCWRLVFNQDDTDGYFCTFDSRYSRFDRDQLADLELCTKRFTLRESISAAIEYLESK